MLFYIFKIYSKKYLTFYLAELSLSFYLKYSDIWFSIESGILLDRISDLYACFPVFFGNISDILSDIYKYPDISSGILWRIFRHFIWHSVRVRPDPHLQGGELCLLSPGSGKHIALYNCRLRCHFKKITFTWSYSQINCLVGYQWFIFRMIPYPY